MTGADHRRRPGGPRRVGAFAILAAAWFACTLITASAGAATPGSLFPSGPLVQLIDTTESANHTDVSIQFSCSMHYLSNIPQSHGSSTTIRLRLGADCGSQFQAIPPELPLVGGGGRIVTGARVDSMMPGEISVELTFARPLDFVMAPTASGLGLRVRLLNTNPNKGSVLVAEPQAPGVYSVNLDSSRTPITRATVEAAAADLQTQAYVSETDIGDQHWYRLRVGPYTGRAAAERVLKAALAHYPRAWVAAGDEQAGLAPVENAGVQAVAATAPTDPPLPDPVRAQILRDARGALAAHRYAQAVDLLTRLVRQPEYPQRADAQELLGITRERAGQLAQAIAEYQEYLRRYPSGSAASRVRMRLQTLAAASIAPKSGGVFGPASNQGWLLAGSAALSYEYGRDQTISAGTSTTTNSVNAALLYGDFLARDRGKRYDFTARIDGGYTQNMVSTFGGSQDRTTAAYGEVVDRYWGLTARFGRQSLASQGIVGLFDGLYVGYQINPRWSVSGAAGLPAYTSYSSVSSSQKFGTVTAEYSPAHHPWVFDAYLFDQTNDIGTERRSAGFQARYTELGRTAVMLVDYDFAFRQLNSATLIGNAKVGQHWVLGFDADHRRSPLLELSNALIGQSATDLRTLAQQFTPSQIRQMALDRTATSNTFVLSANRPFGERWQLMVDLSALELGGTPASYGVVATQSTGLDKNGSVQTSVSSLMQAGDLHIFGLRFDDSPTARSTTVTWDARFVLPGTWRLGPRLSVEQLNDPTLGGKQMLYLPELRGDWSGRNSLFELTAGYQIVNQQTLLQLQSLTGQSQTTAVNQRSLYVSAAYRVRF